MKINVVVPSQRTANFISSYFEDLDLTPKLEATFYGSEKWVPSSELVSMANSLLREHSRTPLLLIADSTTFSVNLQQEQDGMIKLLMNNAGQSERFRVFSFRPELEVVFFEIKDLDLDSGINVHALATQGPKIALNTHMDGEAFPRLTSRIRTENLWNQSPQMRELETLVRDFIASLTENTPAKEKAPA